MIPGNQFGFRQGLGAAQQALNLMQDVKDKTGPRKVAVAALINVEEAYDKVWRGGVQFKMKKLGIPVELIKITSWLQERKFRVKILQSLSQERNATEGLPQDSPLSLLLFDIFVIDLPEAITVPNSRVFQFADDTLIVVQGLKLELSLKK